MGRVAWNERSGQQSHESLLILSGCRYTHSLVNIELPQQETNLHCSSPGFLFYLDNLVTSGPGLYSSQTEWLHDRKKVSTYLAPVCCVTRQCLLTCPLLGLLSCLCLLPVVLQWIGPQVVTDVLVGETAKVRRGRARIPTPDSRGAR